MRLKRVSFSAKLTYLFFEESVDRCLGWPQLLLSNFFIFFRDFLPFFFSFELSVESEILGSAAAASVCCLSFPICFRRVAFSSQADEPKTPTILNFASSCLDTRILHHVGHHHLDVASDDDATALSFL